MIAISTASAAPHAAPGPNLATIPVPQRQPDYRAFVAEQTARARGQPIRLLFIGDSITAMWMRAGPRPWSNVRAVWDRWYGHRDAFEMGAPGDQTQNVLWRLRQSTVDGLDPRLVVLLIGTNNIGQGQPPEMVAQGILAVARELHRRLPTACILVLGLYPREPPARNDACTEVNALLAREVPGLPSASFVDIGHALLRDGLPDPSLYIEGSKGHQVRVLHPNAFGAQRLARALEPEIVRWLGSA